MKLETTFSPNVNVKPRIAFRGKSDGFTIIELMITLVIAAILMAIAIPSFTYLTVTNRLTTTANELVNRLGLARSDAIKRNALLRIAVDGSISVVDPNDPTQTNLLAPALASAMTLPNYSTFSYAAIALNATQMGMLQQVGSGVGYTGLVADVSSSRISTNNHRCVYVTTGMTVSSCTDSVACGGGAPNATCR